MKFKKIMLVAFLALAILTIGAVSAVNDVNGTLAVDDVEELSQDSGDEVLSIDDNDVMDAANEESESDLSNEDGESVLNAKSYVEIDVWSYSDLDNSQDYFVDISAPKDARGNVTVECGNVVYFNKSLTQCRYDGENEDEIYYCIGAADLNTALDVGLYDFTIRYTGDDHYGSSSHRNTVYFRSGDRYEPNDNVTITVYGQVYLDRNNDWEDYLARIEAPASATGNVTVLINGGKAFEGEVATMFIHPSDLNVALEYGVTYDVEVRYAGDGTYEEAMQSGRVKTIYQLDASIINKRINYEESGTLTITLPENADGILTVEIEGKTYPIAFTSREIDFEVFTDNLTIGTHSIIINYKDDSVYPEGNLVVNISVEPKVIYSTSISSAEESFIVVSVPEGTSGTVRLSGEGVEMNASLEGRTIIKIPKLTPSAYAKYINVISTIDGQRYVGYASPRVRVNTEGFSSNVSSSEIIIGDNVTVNITGQDTISQASIFVDENKYDVNSTTNTLIETISGLTVGQHVIHVYVSKSGSSSVFYSNSFLITVKGYCNIAFNATGGAGTMADVRVDIGRNFTLPECGFTKEYRIFYGWNVGDAIRQPGENITILDDININTVWKFNVTAEPGKPSVINLVYDSSTTYIDGILILTDIRTGEVSIINITVGPEESTYTNPDNLTNTSKDVMINETIRQLLALANIRTLGKDVTINNQTLSNATVQRYDNRENIWFNLYEGADDLIQESGRVCLSSGDYGSKWSYPLLLEAEFESDAPTNIKVAKVVLSKTRFTYNGKVQKPTVTVIGGTILKEGVDYTVVFSQASPKNAATYTVTVIGKGAYAGTVKVTYKINKAANPLKIKGKTVKVKFKKLKKKAQNIKVSKAIKFTKKGQGTLTYAKKSGSKKIKINKKTGKITIKKGLKKGTYKIKITVKAKGNKNYKASTVKKATIKIKIK